ncbi:unnamed protein product [Paramecium pentaurelia]|uniref:H-type lectin domain-containing protein n=1 Tax=Paramecium pentaurelia TaxID=43138 RepID=A0A8S1W2U5_9CILI|nr:unnamed protein product [Paramecium pentaurelia]
MIFQFLLIQFTQGIITESSGEVTQFSYQVSGFNCQNGYTSTINFPDTFANIPKLILYPSLFDFASITSNQPIAKIEIVSLTLTNFQIKLTCPQQRINTYTLKWYAIDDQRLIVINEFNLNPLASKSFTFQNPNIKKAIVSIIGIGYKGSFEVTLSISDLTSTSVTVNYNSYNTNMVLLGYQVILGTDEIISYIDKISSSNVYTSPQYPVQSNSYFITAFSKFQQGLDNGIVTLRTTINQGASVVNYDISRWGSGLYPQNTIQSYWLKYTVNNPFLAMECFTVRVSKLFEMNSDQKPAFQLEFFEINKVVNTIGSESILINESITLLNIHIYYKCPSNNKKVHSQMNKCNNCSGSNKIYNLNHHCHGSINTINIYAKYNAQSNYKELTLTTTSNSITIVQKLTNKIITQETILFVEFLDV